MNDPIAPVIKAIQKDPRVHIAWQRGKNWLSEKFLNATAEVFEFRGFETTRTFLLDKKYKAESREQAEVLLAVLDHLDCSAVHGDRPIGRTIIKALHALKPERRAKQ